MAFMANSIKKLFLFLIKLYRGVFCIFVLDLFKTSFSGLVENKTKSEAIFAVCCKHHS